MRSLARVLGTLNFTDVDCAPVFLEHSGFVARLAGISLERYLTEADIMVAVKLEAVKKFRTDIMSLGLDSCVEAEALGSKVVFSNSAYPYISSSLITDWHQLDRLTVPDPWSSGRMPLILQAAKVIVEKDAGEHFIVGQVLGPVTIASQIYGIEKLIYLIVDDPEGFMELLKFTSQVTERYCEALGETGIHAIMLHDPSASPDVLSKGVFTSFIAPQLKAMFERIKKRQETYLWLQIIGNTTSVLHHMADFNLEMVTIDTAVKLPDAFHSLQNKVVVGNMNPMLFRNATFNQLASTLRQILEQRREFGYVMGTGCETPLDASEEKITYFLELIESIKCHG
ncbi:uroporphyrinogen decarboxylase family protein [Desulfosporosinus nitroreducens]|uniref:Uroporphyrinogen decarboxylase family protein n=1 Tax=Desulfosporosinus nitroreducens TaxID=2018668 RepID=A0ABT8QS44_9FIRM|nr:uroporphyrinogen decarboxylase family protein [Desulfosporosinus nitroreducens]MCO1601781.1 uroporphyrinogen decarboxylase family protein [Desulfosporosinus nitroreducens]MDO0823324.1 uroporphyrinogen decarboxylase family protein [Desulfosporosinus nitroreducens]